MKAPQMLMRVAAATVCALTLSGSPAVYAQTVTGNECLPGLAEAFIQRPIYGRLYGILQFNQAQLRAQLGAVDDQASYATLLTTAEAVASSIDEGRVVLALPDGTVVLDTASEDDPTNMLARGNSYAHFQAKTVNENHNTRVAFMSAQMYPCGVGLERKVSTTTNLSETYVAVRLGRHLNSVGTARLSTNR